MKATEYLFDWCPLDDELLDHAKWMDFNQKLKFTFNSVEYFLTTYSNILHDVDTDKLNDQFIDYQFLSSNEIPDSVTSLMNMTTFLLWGYLLGMKVPGTITPKFDLLF